MRKATLAFVLTKAGSGLRLNEHLDHEDGEVVFRHACKLRLEGIVSKRKGSPYRSGHSPDWLKMKNPAAPAVKREARRSGDGERPFAQKQVTEGRAGAEAPDDYDVIGDDGSCHWTHL